MDLEDRGHRVLDVGQLEGQLLLAGEGADRRDRLVGVLLDRFPGPEELREDLQLLQLLPEESVVGQDRLGLLELSQRLLCGDVVVPELRGARLFLELGLVLLGPRDVKDSPGERARSRRAR
jgi:hypothetical protein